MCLPEPLGLCGRWSRVPEGLLEGLAPCHLSVWWPPPFLALRGFAAFPDLYKPNQGVQGHLKFKKLASGATSLSLSLLLPPTPTSPPVPQSWAQLSVREGHSRAHQPQACCPFPVTSAVIEWQSDPCPPVLVLGHCGHWVSRSPQHSAQLSLRVLLTGSVPSVLSFTAR